MSEQLHAGYVKVGQNWVFRRLESSPGQKLVKSRSRIVSFTMNYFVPIVNLLSRFPGIPDMTYFSPTLFFFTFFGGVWGASSRATQAQHAWSFAAVHGTRIATVMRMDPSNVVLQVAALKVRLLEPLHAVWRGVYDIPVAMFKAQLGEAFLEIFIFFLRFFLFYYLFWQNRHLSPQNRHSSGRNRHLSAQTGT